MSRYLPSPVALRTFEAAARHLSFTLAARELLVTQSAVSHQVKALEDELGVRLFLRRPRQLRLTEAGERLNLVLQNAFDNIEAAVDEMRVGGGSGPLRIGSTPYFAALWLTRRLGQFSANYPDIEMNLHLTNEDVDFSRIDLDVAVTWGRGRWAGLESEVLIQSRIMAVCSPGLLERTGPIAKVRDLASQTLLRETDLNLWKEWFVAMGVKGMKGARSLTMNDPNIVHQAAIDGQGIALGAEALLEEEIEQGRLVRLFEKSVQLNGAYYLVHEPGARKRAQVETFCDWLLTEASLSKPANAAD